MFLLKNKNNHLSIILKYPLLSGALVEIICWHETGYTSTYNFIWQDDNFLLNVVKEREDELGRRTLTSLNDMRIKFPGKSDEEADLILDKVSLP